MDRGSASSGKGRTVVGAACASSRASAASTCADPDPAAPAFRAARWGRYSQVEAAEARLEAQAAPTTVQMCIRDSLGRYALVVAPDLFLDLQRLQPSTGMLEIDRIQKLIGDNVFMTSALAPGKAVLVCAEPEYLDLAVGLDLSLIHI